LLLIHHSVGYPFWDGKIQILIWEMLRYYRYIFWNGSLGEYPINTLVRIQFCHFFLLLSLLFLLIYSLQHP
jgi:hypothetical protein